MTSPIKDYIAILALDEGLNLMKSVRYFKYIRSMSQINMALSRGAATRALRQTDPTNPNSWEFSGCSQNGEDGIIDFLTRRLLRPNRYFIEIGSGDGTENNTSWLALARRYSGLMIEGNRKSSEWCNYLLTPLSVGLETICLFVNKDNIDALSTRAVYSNPDVFSLDIDGTDYYVAEAILESDLRPKICVVEYNSAFGPSKTVTIRYQEEFHRIQKHNRNLYYGWQLYYGCSVNGWKKLFARFGYRFVSVESNGVNALFIDPSEFDNRFVDQLKGLEFQENVSHVRAFKMNWEKLFELLKDTELFEINY